MVKPTRGGPGEPIIDGLLLHQALCLIRHHDGYRHGRVGRPELIWWGYLTSGRNPEPTSKGKAWVERNREAVALAM